MANRGNSLLVDAMARLRYWDGSCRDRARGVCLIAWRRQEIQRVGLEDLLTPVLQTTLQLDWLANDIGLCSQGCDTKRMTPHLTY